MTIAANRTVQGTASRIATSAGRADLSGVLDCDLVERLAGRSATALQELYRRHSAAVFVSAVRVLRDAGQAAEVSQDVFVGLWRQPDRFDPSRGPLGAFLCLQARRRAIDVRRSNVSRDRREERVADHTRSDPDDGAPWQAVWSAHVRAAVGALDATQRAPIELAFFGGHSYREVAELLGEPEGTVKSRIRAGLLVLRSVLTGRDPVTASDGAASWTLAGG